jgi:hypothetical protein
VRGTEHMFSQVRSHCPLKSDAKQVQPP